MPRLALVLGAVDWLKWLAVAAMLLVATTALAAPGILATRVWPSEEYTRVTLEAPRAVRHQFFFVHDPVRLVVDLEGVELDAELRAFPRRWPRATRTSRRCASR